MTLPGCNCGNKHCSSHISNKSRLHEPAKVIGANRFPSLRAAIQLTRESAFARFELIKPLPNLAVTIWVVFSIIDACLINIDNLICLLALQALLKLLAFQLICLLVTVRRFFRLNPNFFSALLMFCCVTLSPHNRAISLWVLPPCALTNSSKRSQCVILCPLPFWKLVIAW